MEDVQYLIGHAEPGTTTLYDRRKKRVMRTIVERIPI
jgi:integrase/recombinase XerD